MWKNITEEEKQKYKAFFEGKTGIFIIEKLARDITERSKLPEAIEFRTKLGYNHDNIIVREETSIAEKIKKLFPHEDIALNKKINNKKPDIWFTNHNFIIEFDEGNHQNYDSNDEKKKKKEKTCLKSIILKFFDVIPMILILIFLNF